MYFEPDMKLFVSIHLHFQNEVIITTRGELMVNFT